MSALQSLASGWWVAVAAHEGDVRMVFQFDPGGEMPASGISCVTLTGGEVEALIGDLTAAVLRLRVEGR